MAQPEGGATGHLPPPPLGARQAQGRSQRGARGPGPLKNSWPPYWAWVRLVCNFASSIGLGIYIEFPKLGFFQLKIKNYIKNFTSFPGVSPPDSFVNMYEYSILVVLLFVTQPNLIKYNNCTHFQGKTSFKIKESLSFYF